MIVRSCFRRAKEADLIKIVELCELVKKTYSLWNEYYPVWDNFYEDYNNNLLFLYEIDNKIIGAIGAEKSEWHARTLTLHMFMVHPDYRSQGYGTALFKGTEKTLLDEGWNNLDLLVRNDNPQAIKMYIRLGYRNLGQVKTPWDFIEGKFYYLFVKDICGRGNI
ncbi:MAG TPA: GNAT family N-acetyltransferase [Bacilli bacterium]|nr:GNAT family N-acetyltransferase [Bacilli bacterium]